MKSDIRNKWIDILLEPESTQTQGRLCRFDEGKCCLGWLCELYHRETGNGYWDDIGDFVVNGKHGVAVLPKAVIDWAELSSHNPYVVINGEEVCLSTMNDTGKSLSEIAQVIKEKM